MNDLTRPTTNLPKALAAGIAALLVAVALLGPLALAPSTAGAAQPSGNNEYQLNLPGDGVGNSDSSSGGSSALVPIAIGAGVLTVIVILFLVRSRRQED